jgi:uncharacterized membrane protein
MSAKPRKAFLLAVSGVGLIAGLRSVSAPAAVSAALSGENVFAARLAPILRLLALGEMVADKLPFMPPRTAPFVLAGRALLGAGAGAALAAARRRSWLAGALLAGLAAVASSYAGLALRSAAAERLGLPDQLVALAEDAVVVTAGRALR